MCGIGAYCMLGWSVMVRMRVGSGGKRGSVGEEWTTLNRSAKKAGQMLPAY